MEIEEGSIVNDSLTISISLESNLLESVAPRRYNVYLPSESTAGTLASTFPFITRSGAPGFVVPDSLVTHAQTYESEDSAE